VTEKAPVQPIYYEKGDGPPCRLTKADVLALEQLMCADFSEAARFSIDTRLPNVELDAESAKSFFESNLLPDILTRLSLSCRERAPSTHNRRVYVGLHPSNVSLAVTSDNHEWAVGRYAAITRFLKERRPWYWPAIQLFASPTWMGFLILFFVIAVPLAWYLGQPMVARAIMYGFMLFWCHSM